MSNDTKYPVRSATTTLNFWEARQAALEGKKVRQVGKLTILGANAFQDTFNWNNRDLDAEWEIVEEPVQFTNYVNIYTKGMHDWTAHDTKKRADRLKADNRIACIEFTVDENGKLISARNV